MERINETNILELVCLFYKVQNHINVKNDFSDTEEEESDINGANPEDNGKKEINEADQSRIAGVEDKRSKMRTNLEFLLSQNDILPLIRKINKENLKNSESVSISKYIKRPEKVK